MDSLLPWLAVCWSWDGSWARLTVDGLESVLNEEHMLLEVREVDRHDFLASPTVRLVPLLTYPFLSCMPVHLNESPHSHRDRYERPSP
jgi:hypothetical protein